MQLRTSADVGMALVEGVYKAMGIDEEWSVWRARGYEWWGKDFRQRVWAEPVVVDAETEVCVVHAATDLLKDASSTEVCAKVAHFNCFASLSGLVWNANSGHVRYHAKVVAHEQNLSWMLGLFQTAVAIQAADAQIKGDGLAKLFGGTPDRTEHPVTGRRDVADEMLGIISSLVVPMGDRVGDEVFAVDFQRAKQMFQNQLVCTSGRDGFTTEFPFVGSTKSHLFGKNRSEQTSLATVILSDHPQLRRGLLFKLHLPGTVIGDASEAACKLALAELSDPKPVVSLGGWCVSQDKLVFCGFIPAFAYRQGFVGILIGYLKQHSDWARRVTSELGILVP